MKKGVTKEMLIASLASTLRLTQTEVTDLVLVDKDTVKIVFESGYSITANIACDSGIACIRDICKLIN